MPVCLSSFLVSYTFIPFCLIFYLFSCLTRAEHSRFLLYFHSFVLNSTRVSLFSVTQKEINLLSSSTNILEIYLIILTKKYCMYNTLFSLIIKIDFFDLFLFYFISYYMFMNKHNLKNLKSFLILEIKCTIKELFKSIRV